MNLENIGKDCPCYEVDCSDIMFDIGEFCGLPPNNGKLTIQVNGSTVGDFSANQQEDETINITTPTSQDIADAVDGEARLREQADNTLQSNINAEELARQRADRDIQAVLDGESLARVNEDRNLQSQIDAIASKSDVVDVVGTYAELQAYDTSKLNDNDVVKVLDDSTHNDAMTYYRWNKTTQTWSYIGQESPYYSKSQTDNLLATKQDNLSAGNGITLNGSTISADTTVLAEKSELSNYAEKSDTYTKTEVDNLVEPKLSVDVVEQLPVQGEESKLYLTPKAHTTQTATGNPITATITDGAGQIEDFQLDGDTFQQSYTGKNLLSLQGVTTTIGIAGTVKDGSTVTVTGTTGTSVANNRVANLDSQIPAGTYTLTIDHASDHVINLTIQTSGGDAIFRLAAGETSKTVTLAAGSTSGGLFWGVAQNTTYNETFKLQLVAGSTPDYDYEPYVGGIASPNPTYPQSIQVVTGTQTIAINGTNYPLDLGTIELCKLGTYQDRIYKDGSDWKIHKETGKVDLASIAWQTYAYTLKRTGINPIADMLYVQNNQQVGVGLTEGFQIRQGAGLSGAEWLGYFAIDTNRIAFNVGQGGNDPSGRLYYALATATDTAITDQTLIAQLEAIASSSLETGTNTLTNSATGSNLAGDMEVDYFGYDPTNRYDKWLWLDINNAYEKLGS